LTDSQQAYDNIFELKNRGVGRIMSNDKLRVAVTGVLGKMGQEAVRAILRDEGLELVGGVDIRGQGTDLGLLTGSSALGKKVTADLAKLLEESGAQVMVDFTNPQAVRKNIYTALEKKVHAVVGTTGLTEEDLSAIDKLAQEQKVGVFVAPNFALGAVLMMKFAREAARYFPHVEIIEMHHDQKMDAPSGTALRTAELILQSRGELVQGSPHEFEKIGGVRGGEYHGIRLHSVRLPGLVAHQEVIFGGLGQTLTIRHDSINRESFMPGLILAIHKVIHLKGVVVGLEHLLEV